jgi:DNA-binding SARP family transcriptional activator
LVQSFESQKARALLAFLALDRDQSLEREKLAGLLWSERSTESARRNLRQALYSIRSAVAGEKGTSSLFQSAQRTLQITPEIDCWVDVDAFEESARRGLGEPGPDPHHLAAAARLYRGDFLAGFYLQDSPLFEEWHLAMEERLREEAIETLRTLVSLYLQRGEVRFGVQYAKRLLAIDPLSEEAHRQLMRLYHLDGRRDRALAQYEHLRNLLNDELGVEPLEETTELYRSVLLENRPPSSEAPESELVGPIIPLVGRSRSFDELQTIWQQVCDGSGRITFVEGEAGVGKSRLVKSFVDGATSKRLALVLRGRCYPAAPPVSFGPFREVLTGVLADVLPDEPRALERLGVSRLRDLLQMVPQLGTLAREILGIEIELRETDSERSVAAFVSLLRMLTRPSREELRPVILLLEDLQWADGPSLDLLAELAVRTADEPIWLLTTVQSAETGLDRPLRKWQDSPPENANRLHLTRLRHQDIEELAVDLVDFDSAAPLADFLWAGSEGLPLLMTELINLLWDEGVLLPGEPGQWRFHSPPRDALTQANTISELIHRRVQKLPASARRLLSLAAVMGQNFDVEVLQIAGNEHLTVVETFVQLALERWLIRQFPRSWSQAGLERDIILWARGARRGSFEFAHRAVRESVLDHMNPLRRQVMHREVAAALHRRYEQDRDEVAEDLAFHQLEAGEFEQALPWLERSAVRARTCGGHEIALLYCQRALEVLDRLEGGASDGDKELGLRHSREHIDKLLAGLTTEA